MKITSFVYSALIGLVASCRSMTPMAAIAAARIKKRDTPGRLLLLDRPLFKFGALAMGIGELFGDKMKSAPDRTVFLGMSARVASAGIAGAALAPCGKEKTGAAIAISTAVPLAYATQWLSSQRVQRVVKRTLSSRKGPGTAYGRSPK